MALTNDNIVFMGGRLNILGDSLAVGRRFPDFKLTGMNFADVSPSDFDGKILIVSVVPSLDTPLCSEQTSRFNKDVDSLGGKAAVLAVSMDLPFAQGRWCGANNGKNVKTASDYKYQKFGRDTGTYIQDSGLLTRAVFVIDAGGVIRHVEYVDDTSNPPNYAAAMAVVRSLAA